MAADLPQSASSAPQPRPAQFSLATIFIVTTIVAFILALIFVFPDWLAGPMILFLMLAVPAVLAVGAKFGPGSWTAFCLGALVPTGTILIGIAFTFFVLIQQAGLGVARPPTAIRDPLTPFGQWLAATAMLGVAWRPIAVTSWGVSVVIGILCVNVRRFILRRNPG
jgi:hypothetical protein